MHVLNSDRFLNTAATALCTGLAVGFLAVAADAAEFNLRAAHIYPQSVAQSGKNFDDWAKRINEATDGRVKVNIIHGGTLLNAADHLDGIANGLVDVTAFYPIFFPGEFKVEGSLTNIIDIWSEEVPDLEGVARIHAQLHSEFPEFRDEYQRRNIRMLLPLPADPYVVACTEPVKNMDDLEGRKTRTFGRYFPILQEGLGVEPIVVPASETYQALQTGLLDCVFSTPDFMYSSSFHEVAPHLFIPGPEKARPQLLATVVIAMNTASFDRLPEDIRNTIDEVSNEMTSDVGATMTKVYGEAIKKFQAIEGSTTTFITGEELSRWAARTPNQLDQAAADMTESGYNGAEIIARYRELARDYVNGVWP